MTWPRNFFLIATSLAIASDTVMASNIVYHLYKTKPTIQRTRGIVSWLIVYYVNTGVILVSLSVSVLIAFTLSPHLEVWVSLINVFAKVLACSFFGVLNSRELLRTKMGSLLIIDTKPYESQASEKDSEGV
ncbi:hypothetical protein QCA50_013146 [Cerrena zonata]|uniref:DUF6534 domain-containing protein n=1 Tax=Cerrena zonata TaxID=2478898 RepID=A0AAW0G3X8_9APHY